MSALNEWREANRAYLALALDGLHAVLEDERSAAGEELSELWAGMSHAPALEVLTSAFGLDDFERTLVLWCLGVEVDPRFRSDLRPVTIAAAIELLPDAHWTALDESGALRSWGIVEFQAGVPLADVELRLAPDVVRFLLGFDPRDEPFAPFVPIEPGPALAEERAAAAAELAATVSAIAGVSHRAPAVELHGAAEEDRLEVAVACAAALDATVLTADVADLPAPGADLDAVLRAWSRRARMTGSWLCLTTGRDGDEGPDRRVAVALDRLRDPLFVSRPQATTTEPDRPLVRHATAPLTTSGRLTVWAACVNDARKRRGARRTRGLAAELEDLATQFRFGARTIARVCLEAEAHLDSDDPLAHARVLRDGCLDAIDARLGPHAERVPLEERTDVVLGEHEARLLDELATQIRLLRRVDEQWGMSRGPRHGPVALFAGPTGTGKTHAAAALARRCGLALYRVQISSVLSKYIGETERNLEQVFEAAAIGGTILLFDEADALFGKRSEVRDSHDRYANLGTSYLLQRIERSPTPIVLTTNIRDAIDPAFVRRLHMVIEFPFPGEVERAAIWSSAFPASVPLADFEPERLARVVASGATIDNIARRSAYLAAANDDEVTMAYLLESAQRELEQLGRALSSEELSAWR